MDCTQPYWFPDKGKLLQNTFNPRRTTKAYTLPMYAFKNSAPKRALQNAFTFSERVALQRRQHQTSFLSHCKATAAKRQCCDGPFK